MKFKMSLFKTMKDGGPLSRVWGLFLIEIKSLFSIVFLRFKGGSREAFHTHAFNAVSWVVWGKLTEELITGEVREYRPSFKPIYTPRNCFHKVTSTGNTFAVTFRGPWLDQWQEFLPDENKFVFLTHGRNVVRTVDA